MMGARGLLFSALLLVGCDDLPAAQNGLCGNKVVDPNEDCDTYAIGTGTLCRSPGTTGQCRYACNTQPDGTTPRCPADMGCGTDGTCRTASGKFVAASQPVTGTFADLLVGDVDGDHRADVVGLEARDFATTFFDGTLTSATTVRTTRSSGASTVHPLLRDISGDGLADLLAAASSGTLVNLGSSSRAFTPTACPSINLPVVNNARLIILKALPSNPGDTAFMMTSFNTTNVIVLLQKSGQGTLFTLMSQPPTNVAGLVAVGHMVEDPALSPCDEIAFGYVGGSDVEVYTACGPDGKGGINWNSYDGVVTVPTKVALPPLATLVRGPMLLDVNADGHLDFLVGASRCSGCNEIDVAYGVGDGTFHSNPLTIPKTMGDGAFSVYPLVTGSLPLAMGDVNADGVPDYVTENTVLVSSVVGKSVTFTARAEGHAAAWTEAVIADLNHDGLPDVAAGSSAGPNIDFFNGLGNGTFNPFVIQSAPVSHLTVGDYDGDLINDLAVAELARPTDLLGDSMSVLWGNPAGAPNGPVSMGRFVSIQQIAAARSLDPFKILSGTPGILTVSLPNTKTTYFGGFPSSGDRVLRSPLILTTVAKGSSLVTGIPQRYVYGHFTSATATLELAAIDSQSFPMPTSPVHRAWLLGMDGQGGFDTTQLVASSELDETAIEWSTAAIAAVDLDGSGTDQLVALGRSPKTDVPRAVAAIARAAPTSSGPFAFTFGAATAVAGLVQHVEDVSAQTQTGRVLTTDLDGDGRPDVVAVASVAGVTSVVVFWNDHGGQLGPMTPLLPNPSGRVVDFAVVSAAGTGPSLAILTDQGVSLVSFTQRFPSAPALAFGVTNGQLIASGDVDGDGVADLVVSADTGFVVYRGQPVRP